MLPTNYTVKHNFPLGLHTHKKGCIQAKPGTEMFQTTSLLFAQSQSSIDLRILS